MTFQKRPFLEQFFQPLRRLITNLFLMAHGDHQSHVWLQSVERYIATRAKADRPFLKLWVHVIDGTARVWMVCNDLHTCTDSNCGTSGSIRIFLGKKTVKTLHISQRLWRPD
jgi:hypothetical protein